MKYTYMLFKTEDYEICLINPNIKMLSRGKDDTWTKITLDDGTILYVQYHIQEIMLKIKDIESA